MGEDILELPGKLAQNGIDYIAKQYQLLYDTYFPSDEDNSDKPITVKTYISGYTAFAGANVYFFDSSVPDNYNPFYAGYLTITEDSQPGAYISNLTYLKNMSVYSGSASNLPKLEDAAERMLPGFFQLSADSDFLTPVITHNGNFNVRLGTTGLYWNDAIYNLASSNRQYNAGADVKISVTLTNTLSSAYGHYSTYSNKELNLYLGNSFFILDRPDSNLVTNLSGSTHSYTASNGKTYNIKSNDFGISLPFSGDSITYDDIRNAFNIAFSDDDTLSFPTYNDIKYGPKSEYYIEPIEQLPPLPTIPDPGESLSVDFKNYPSVFGHSVQTVINAYDALSLSGVLIFCIVMRVVLGKLNGR